MKANKGIVRVLTVFFIGIAVISFCWWVGRQIYGPMQTAGSLMIQNAQTNSTISDAIETAFANADAYMAVVALIFLGFWVLANSQRKGEQVWAE